MPFLSCRMMNAVMEQTHWNTVPVGLKIRFYRIGASLNLDELAREAQLSASYLSKIERGRSTPTVANLERICAALQVTFEQLLAKPPLAWTVEEPAAVERKVPVNLRPVLVREAERLRIMSPRSQLSYELLTPDLRRKLQFTLVRHPANHESPTFNHEGEESLLCLRGSLRVIVGEEQFVLSAGDCLSFGSSIPHRIVNESSSEAVLISVNTPTSFLRPFWRLKTAIRQQPLGRESPSSGIEIRPRWPPW